MTKTKLISSLSSAMAISLLSTPIVQASENPFSIQQVENPIQLTEAMQKGAEGKCGDKQKKDASMEMEKTKEGKCGEGKCGDKTKKNSDSVNMEKAKEGKCGEGKCGDKIK